MKLLGQFIVFCPTFRPPGDAKRQTDDSYAQDTLYHSKVKCSQFSLT